MRPFQLALVGIFVFLALAGIAVFAFFKGGFGTVNPYGESVVIWGTLEDAPFVNELGLLTRNDPNLAIVSYVEKDPRTFEQELLDALAEGRGPDLIILPHDMLLKQRSKLAPIPYENYPVRTFKDAYIDGAEIFLLAEGIYAIPIAVDPLMMYWNRDIFATKNLANPPRSWEELVGSTLPAITERDFSYNILRAVLAFGEYDNIRNAKEILSMLFLQAGSNMVVDTGNGFSVQLNQGSQAGSPPGMSTLNFYTQFANPAKNTYTWNRAMPLDRDAFLAEDLALYFGFSSEISEIRDGNPNLNFDVAEVPQLADARLKKGYGTIYGMALLRNSRNYRGAYAVRSMLVGQKQVEGYAETLGFGTVHRASHVGVPQDPFRAVVERATLVARGWLDPDTHLSDNIFKQMVEDTTSGRSNASVALNDAEGRLRQLIK